MTWATLPSGVEVYRRRGTTVVGTDRYGNDILEPVVELLPHRAAFDPGGSSEPVAADRTSVVTAPTLYFAEPVDVREGDDVEVASVWYRVDGRPAAWASPFGGDIGGTVVTLGGVAG